MLLVEDDRVLQKIALRLLKSLGHESDTANDGLEAVQMATATRYDFIFMDLNMPRLDGAEAARRISRESNASATVGRPPVLIALTSERLHGDFERYRAAGFADWIAKPVQVESLKHAIEKWTADAPAGGELIAPHPETLKDSGSTGEGAGVDFTASGAPPADLERIRQLGDGDSARIREFVGLFLGQITTKFEALETAVAQGARNEIRKLAHFCAGSSATCGMTALAAPLRELEDLALKNDLSRASQLMKQSQEALKATRSFLSERLGQ